LPTLGQPVAKIAAGFGHSLLIRSDGSLWSTGDNYSGALGDGTLNSTNRPERIVSAGVVAIAGGCGHLDGHSLFLLADGSLWGMGDNSRWQLGTNGGGNGNVITPGQIAANGVTAIAAGQSHNLFIKSDGSLWALGDDSAGQLGDGRTYPFTSANQPEMIVQSGVTVVSGGGSHTLFIKDDGSLWSMGQDYYGQLGDQKINTWTNLPQKVVQGGVVAVAAGEDYSLFIKSDGSLWAMGRNNYGQLGDGTYSNVYAPKQVVAGGVKAVATGWYHTLVLKVDGSLWAMGNNQNGQLGDGTYNNLPQPTQIVPSGVAAIAAGAFHSMFLTTDGSLWAMGWNGYGELGDGANVQAIRPRLIIPGQLPHLGITSISNQPVVVWAGWATGALLQMTTNLDSGNWVTVTGGIPVIGFQITNAPSPAFFRLQ
jgi:alpha-tubulin suppressor-like RCC1 family protein